MELAPRRQLSCLAKAAAKGGRSVECSRSTKERSRASCLARNAKIRTWTWWHGAATPWSWASKHWFIEATKTSANESQSPRRRCWWWWQRRPSSNGRIALGWNPEAERWEQHLESISERHTQSRSSKTWRRCQTESSNGKHNGQGIIAGSGQSEEEAQERGGTSQELHRVGLKAIGWDEEAWCRAIEGASRAHKRAWGPW